MLTHARAGVDTEVESSALSSWSPAAQGGAVAAERAGVGFRESRSFFSATGSSNAYYYLRGDPKGRAPGDQHKTAPNAHPTVP